MFGYREDSLNLEGFNRWYCFICMSSLFLEVNMLFYDWVSFRFLVSFCKMYLI